MTASRQQQIVLAYRHLYQHLLRAVQYSKPARFVVRDQLRNAFRRSTSGSFNALTVSNTLMFLHNAAKTTGLEHRVLKNLVHVHWGRQKLRATDGRKADVGIRRTAYVQFDRTVESLNATMGIRLN
ncbi:hypothetical protein DOTSEDRAFT_19778 [Dothistroma septosporum NZE10]|uniref:DUF1763-domain-containing protein n=1 Tax=Dothistroma septosporum (strain NZE10 / CBS 128990) TaxID=675120 RepID=N1Q0W7_DOTSN|nr:hypothetical protein DOTSEDRAFT_19778 [Dothistroma septosporum NZE10]